MQEDVSKAEEPRQEDRTEGVASDDALKQKVCEGYLNLARGWQKLADETQLQITVSHYPPGTSKGNKSEHRLVCHRVADEYCEAEGQIRDVGKGAEDDKQERPV
jgi:hypothetical protein